ncbi:hypothetical protein HPB52_016905 [Rhipicephalus sanguineus]|uniref:Uncharacterized protein n=1 Tax=Rhipicephalus sanguineus TaxID=34632 RepID=A0A9D4TAX6_RHISA|nr:hypothetical protein HPB52_016905 [Rhipicephalus sanguineus]
MGSHEYSGRYAPAANAFPDSRHQRLGAPVGSRQHRAKRRRLQYLMETATAGLSLPPAKSQAIEGFKSSEHKQDDVDRNGDLPFNKADAVLGGGGGAGKILAVTPKPAEPQYHGIFNYAQIYFFGVNANKRQGAPGTQNNCGYDEDEGSYLHEPHADIAYRLGYST